MKNEFQPFAGIVKDLAWSADSQRIVAVGEGREKFGHVFSMDTGTSIGEISGHSKTINSCDFKPTRPFKIITGSEDNCVGLYEGPPFKLKSQLNDHTRFVQAVRFSPDGNLFATGGFDGKLFIYNSTDYSKHAELGSPAHKGGIYAISWSPDNKQLLSASGDKTCKLWDVASASIVTEFNLGNNVFDQQVSCLWQEPHLLSVSLSGFINYLDKNTPNKPLRIIKGHNKSITALAVAKDKSSDEVRIFTGSHDGYVTNWSAKTGDHDRVAGVQHTNQVQDMTATSENLVYTCGFDDLLKEIDITANQYSSSHSVKLSSQPKGVAAPKDSKIIAIACRDEIVIYESFAPKSTLKLNFEASCIDTSPDCKNIAVGGGKDVHVYSLSDTYQLLELKVLTHRGSVTSLKYSPDGKYIAATDDNRKVWLYLATSYEAAHSSEWGFHLAKVNCIAWAPNSRTLATGGLDTNIIVWFPEEPNKHIIIKHAHPQGQVTKIAFINDNTIVSTGQDATIRTWSLVDK